MPSALRSRLVLGAVALGLVFAVGFGAIAVWRFQHAEDQAITAALLSRVELARDEVNSDGSLTGDIGSPKTDLVQVIGPDGSVRASSEALSGLPPLVELAAVTASPAGVQQRVALQRPDIDLAVLGVPLTLPATGSSPAGQGALLVAVDAEGFNTATQELLGLLIAGLLAMVMAMAALSWIITGRALRTVAKLTERAEEISPSSSDAGLPVPRGDAELARLVGALNRMLMRLHEHHSTELAFAADANHRLRTPVATLRAEAELALRETDPAAMAESLERIVHDADQLTSIVDRMLARNRSGDRVPESVVRTIDEASARWHRQAELAGVLLSIRLDSAVTRHMLCVELLDVVEPILDNAVRHTPPRGNVLVALRLRRAARSILEVDISNEGPPVPDEMAPRLFDAWVSSRDASVAGGLGLWLARETARDLDGGVELLDTSPPNPTIFRVHLPLTEPSSDADHYGTGLRAHPGQ